MWALVQGVIDRCRDCLRGKPKKTTDRGADVTDVTVERREATYIDGQRMTRMREYAIWTGIKDRCFNPESKLYPKYGGRGVVMCEEWRDDFLAFYRFLGPRPSPRHSVGRQDNDVGYMPYHPVTGEVQVKWETPEQQARNKSTTHFITHPVSGETKTLVEWAEGLGLSQPGLRQRIEKWGLERALDTKTVRKKRTSLDPAMEDAVVERYLATDENTTLLADFFGVSTKTIESVLTRRRARSQKIQMEREKFSTDKKEPDGSAT